MPLGVGALCNTGMSAVEAATLGRWFAWLRNQLCALSSGNTRLGKTSRLRLGLSSNTNKLADSRHWPKPDHGTETARPSFRIFTSRSETSILVGLSEGLCLREYLWAMKNTKNITTNKARNHGWYFGATS